MASLKQKFRDEMVPKLKEELGLSNTMEVPRLTKVTLNMGVGEAVGDKKVLENAVADMQKIAGQKPVVTKSGSLLPASRSAMAGPLAAR